MAVDGANTARANALRVQRLLADYREKGILPPANLKGAKGGLTPAQRSAAGQGVGDNLRAAVTDIHTEDAAVATSWVDQLNTDLVNGDGSIDPELAMVSVELYGNGETLQNPDGAAAKVSSLILSHGSMAMLAHRFDGHIAGGTDK